MGQEKDGTQLVTKGEKRNRIETVLRAWPVLFSDQPTYPTLISHLLGVSRTLVTNVYNQMVDLGIEVPPICKRGQSPERVRRQRELQALWEQGLKAEQISEITKISTGVIYKVAHRHPEEFSPRLIRTRKAQ